MGHPDAAYDLDPAAQARLLGWLYARASRRAGSGGGKVEKPEAGRKVLRGMEIFDHFRGQ